MHPVFIDSTVQKVAFAAIVFWILFIWTRSDFVLLPAVTATLFLSIIVIGTITDLVSLEHDILLKRPIYKKVILPLLNAPCVLLLSLWLSKNLYTSFFVGLIIYYYKHKIQRSELSREKADPFITQRSELNETVFELFIYLFLFALTVYIAFNVQSLTDHAISFFTPQTYKYIDTHYN